MPFWHPLVVLVLAATGSWALDRWLLDWLKQQQIRSSIRKDGPATHQAKAKTPALGGIAFPPAFLLATVVGIVLSKQAGLVDLASPRTHLAIALLLFITTIAFLTGFADDYLKVIKKSSEGLQARYRFPIQLLLGILLGWAMTLPGWGEYGQRVPWFGVDPVLLPSVLLIVWTTLFFAGTVNAVNFTDGLDTLLAGTGFTALLVLAGLSYGWFGTWVTPEPWLGHAALAGAGTLLGFYPHNRHPATLFMGDGGAYFLGALMATIAVLQGTPFLFLWIGLVFYIEVGSVILQVASFRLSKGKRRLFPMAPIHHAFEVKGWPEERVVSLFWFVGLAAAVLGIWLGRQT
ncbi:MAG: phospho-N-acetylmuramoyl-pentapeptide-transferase [bacterium]